MKAVGVDTKIAIGLILITNDDTLAIPFSMRSDRVKDINSSTYIDHLLHTNKQTNKQTD